MAACIDNSSNHGRDPFSADPNGCQINNYLCKLIRFCRIEVLSPDAGKPVYASRYCPKVSKEYSSMILPEESNQEDHIWVAIRKEALSDINQEPLLSEYYCSTILAHNSLESALTNHLATKLSNIYLSSDTLYEIFFEALMEDAEIRSAIRADLKAVKERDQACTSHLHCLLNFKGFLACQAHRIVHKFWSEGRRALGLLIQSRVSEVFAVDIHPGARIGKGIVVDHATGIVIGETSVIGNDVTILHDVTLGGTGKVHGDRHPKIGDGVFIGAGAKVLGNIHIGDGAKIGAGSVVLKEVHPHATAVGNPARQIGVKQRTKL